MDLVSPVWSALETERAGDCRCWKPALAPKRPRCSGSGEAKPIFGRRSEAPPALALKLMPRGWVRQNMAHLAVLDQKTIDSVDRLRGSDASPPGGGGGPADPGGTRSSSPLALLVPGQKHSSPHERAPEDNRVQPNRCQPGPRRRALERCRLARGEYPARSRTWPRSSFASLPLDPVSGEPLRYRLTGAGTLPAVFDCLGRKGRQRRPPGRSGQRRLGLGHAVGMD